MSRAGLSAVVLALGLTGCVQYAPAPLHPEQVVTEFDRRLFEKHTPGPWKGGELLAAAIERNPQVAEARAKYVAALNAARAAKTPSGPTLTLTAEYANEAPHWGYSGGGDIPLDYGARRSVRVTTANLQALQAFYDYGETIWSVRVDLERARIDVLAAREELDLARQAAEVRRQRLQRITQRVEAGQDARALAIIAQGEAQVASGRLAAAQGRRTVAMTALAKALGVSQGGLPELQMEGPAAGRGLGDFQQWRRESAQSRRDVLRAVADYDIAENALRLEVANQYPQISLGPGYAYDHGVTKLPFSLSLALPPLDLNRRAIARAEAARTAAGRSLETMIDTVLAAADGANASLASAVQATGGAYSALNLAIRSDTTAKLLTDAGEQDLTDQLAARAAMLEAQLALSDAQHAQALARVDLEDALRRAFDPAQTAMIEAAMTKARGAK